MGRGGGKLKLQLIHNKKKRYLTFLKRKKGLMKKAYEFATLCGVDVCMVIYGPSEYDGDECRMKPEIWPPEDDQVRRVIDRFYKVDVHHRRKNSSNLSSFIQEQKWKAEKDTARLRKKNDEEVEAALLDEFSEDKLREVFGKLSEKIQDVDARIGLIKDNKFVVDCSGGGGGCGALEITLSEFQLQPLCCVKPDDQLIQMNSMSDQVGFCGPSDSSMFCDDDEPFDPIIYFGSSSDHSLFYSEPSGPSDTRFVSNPYDLSMFCNVPFDTGMLSSRPSNPRVLCSLPSDHSMICGGPSDSIPTMYPGGSSDTSMSMFTSGASDRSMFCGEPSDTNMFSSRPSNLRTQCTMASDRSMISSRPTDLIPAIYSRGPSNTPMYGCVLSDPTINHCGPSDATNNSGNPFLRDDPSVASVMPISSYSNNWEPFYPSGQTPYSYDTGLRPLDYINCGSSSMLPSFPCFMQGNSSQMNFHTNIQ